MTEPQPRLAPRERGQSTVKSRRSELDQVNALHVTLSYNSAPALGGPDLTAYKLCTVLRAQGVKVDVLCTNLASRNAVLQPNSFERDVEGVWVRYLATRKLMPLGRHSFGLYYVPELRALLRREIGNYDVIHVHGFRDYMTFVTCQEARRTRVPYVIHPRGTLPYQGHSLVAKTIYDWTFGRRFLCGAARLIALTDREARSFGELGAAMQRVRVIYNGIEAKDYDPHASGEQFRREHDIREQFIVLYFGRIHMIKGIDHMTRAVAQLCRAGLDVAAVVVGPDEGFGNTVRRIASQERFDHLYILPPVRGKQKQDVFAAADVLVYAAQIEDFGVAAFEGILSGVPTIVASNTGCAEVVQRFNAGFVVPYGNIREIVSTIRCILADPDNARHRTLASRSEVVAALDWPDIARRVRALYAEVV